MVDNSEPTSRGRRDAFITLIIALIFCAPLLANLTGLRQGDPFRDEDWLHDISFSFYLKESLLSHQEFPLRTHLSGGGYPILGHPSDGSLSPFSLPFLVLSPELAVRLNLIVLLWLGTLGTCLLARRNLAMDGPASYLASAAFAFSGWFPSFMLTGFYVQAFYLLSPLILHFILGPGGLLARGLLAGLLLCPILFQSGTGLPAVLHFACVGSFLLRCSGSQQRTTAKGLLGLTAVLVVSALIAAQSRWGPWPSGLASIGVLLGALRWSHTRELLIAWKPAFIRLLIALIVLASVGAGKWVSVQDLLSRSDYLEEYLPTQQAQESGAHGFHYQFSTPMEAQDCFYDGLPALLKNLHKPLARETAYRDEQPIDPEYAPLGLTLPVVGVALLGGLLIRRGRALLALLLFYLAVCMGPNLPLDPYRNLIWGLPGFYSLNQPYKYFNFFLVLPISLLFGLGLQGAAEKFRTRRLVAGLGYLLLGWPLLQNSPLLGTLVAEPATISPRAEEFYQVSRPRQLDPDSPDRFGDLTELDRSDREHNRTDDTREFFNVLRGIGVVDWYADIYLDEYAWSRFFVRRDGSQVPNPAYRGEAFCKSSGCSIKNFEITMNSVDVTVYSDGPNRLIINQNYDIDFVSEQGPALEQDGLLAVDLEQAGEHRISLRYRPPHILAALYCSAGSLILVMALLLLAWRKARNQRLTNR